MDNDKTGLDAAFAAFEQAISDANGGSDPIAEETLEGAGSDLLGDATPDIDDDVESAETVDDPVEAAPDSPPVSTDTSPTSSTDATEDTRFAAVAAELTQLREEREKFNQMVALAKQQAQQQRDEQQRAELERQRQETFRQRLSWMQENVPEERQPEYVEALNEEIFARPIMQQAQQALMEREQIVEDVSGTATAMYIAAQTLFPERFKDFTAYVEFLKTQQTPTAMKAQVEREQRIREEARAAAIEELTQERNKKAATRKRERIESGVDTVPAATGGAASAAVSDTERALSSMFGN